MYESPSLLLRVEELPPLLAEVTLTPASGQDLEATHHQLLLLLPEQPQQLHAMPP